MLWRPSRRLFIASGAALIASPAIVRAQSPMRAFPPGMFQSRASLDAASGGGGGTSLAGSSQAITFNPSDLGPGGTLASSNRDFVSTDGAHIFASCRATLGKSSGKFYVEFKLTLVGGTTECVGIGIADAGASLTTYFGNSANSAMIWFNANTDFSSGITRTNAITPGNAVLNDIYGLAVDHGAGKAWLAKNNVYFNSGNPAAGTNPWLTLSAGTYYPGGTQNNGTPNGTLTIPATTNYDAPSGFLVYS